MAAGVFSKKEYELHPEGPCVITLADYEYKGDGQYGPQMQWKFDSDQLMEEGDYAGKPFRISYWTSVNVSPDPRNKLGKLWRAWGVNVDAEDFDPTAVDPDEFLGKKLNGMVVHAPDKQGTMRANLDSFTPIRRKATPASAPAAAPKPAAAAAPVPVPPRTIDADFTIDDDE